MPFAFIVGTASVPAFGSKTKVRFGGTWVAGDSWTTRFVSTLSGNFTLGKGNIAGQVYTCGFKLRDRVFVGFDNSFALSSIVDAPTLWEEQNAGAAVIEFVSQFGPQNTVTAFASLQGRLVVVGEQSIQIWQPDADPNLFSLQQTLDNTGTSSPLSVQNIGDLDVLYLDITGIRSLRAKEITLNAEVNDVGTPIDLLIRAALLGYDLSGVCAIVEPVTRQYWIYINGTIYVLSKHSESKITAWSTFLATYSSAGVQTAFTPQKFVVHNSQVYARASNRKIYLYGGSDNNTYDNAQVIIETSWMDLKDPGVGKQATGVGAAFKGNWKIEVGMDPIAGTLTEVVNQGSTTSPNTTADSTFDIGNIGYSGYGTHFKFKATSGANSTSKKFSKVMLKYQGGGSR